MNGTPIALRVCVLLLSGSEAAGIVTERREVRDWFSALPMVGRPTADGAAVTFELVDAARLSIVLEDESDGRVRECSLRDTGTRYEAVPEGEAGSVLLPAGVLTEIRIAGLEAGSAHRFRLDLEEAEPGERQGAAVARASWDGRFVTQRRRGQAFAFAVVADMHLFVEELMPPIPESFFRDEFLLGDALDSLEWFRKTRVGIETEFRAVARNVEADRPDFVVGLGDHFDLHPLGFNPAFATQEAADTAHRETRNVLAWNLARCGALFQVLGNWEGESGDHSPAERALASAARRRFQVNPRPGTPGYQAAPLEDYYSFEWGDALLVVLNVRGYTRTSHLLGDYAENPGGPDSFTLGEDQRRFLEDALQRSTAPYKLLFIHHAAGGNGGDEENSAYGRGGGRAAGVGEQAWVHGLMRAHGVQVFFYGHDHVFTDMVVDGIHYTLPGTTSAPWRFDGSETGYETYWTDSGHGRVQVTPERLRVEFVNSEGEILHAFDVRPGS